LTKYHEKLSNENTIEMHTLSIGNPWNAFDLIWFDWKETHSVGSNWCYGWTNY
jgi:hypothetical protein